MSHLWFDGDFVFFFSSEQFTTFTGAVLNAIKMCLMAMSECRLKRTKKNMFVDLFQCFFSRLCAHKKKETRRGQKNSSTPKCYHNPKPSRKKVLYIVSQYRTLHLLGSPSFLFHLPKKFALFTLVVMA